MPLRTNSAAVAAVLGQDYEAGDAVNDIPATDLTPFMTSANAIVNQVVVLAGSSRDQFRAALASDSATQELIERWLSAHFYCAQDKPEIQKTTQGASASFQGQKQTQGLDTTEYGRRAITLDYSGKLNALDKRAFARTAWLGKPVSQQVPYCQRN